MPARVEGSGIISQNRHPKSLGSSADTWGQARTARQEPQRGQMIPSCAFTAAYKFHKKEMNYALLGLHKVTQ